VFAAAASLVLVAAACDWPMVGFLADRSASDPIDTAITPANVSTLQPLWSAAVPAPTAPVLAGGHVFVSSQPSAARPDTAELDAFDAAGITSCTGPRPAVCTPRWAASYGPPGPPTFPGVPPSLSAPAATNNRLYVGVDTFQPLLSFSELDAYDPVSGTKTLAVRDGGTTSPIVSGGRVYQNVDDVVHPGPGIVIEQYLEVHDATTGAVQFAATTSTSEISSSGEPAVSNGVLYAVQSGVLGAWDATGATNCAPSTFPVSAPVFCAPLWTAALPNAVAHAPAVFGGSIYVADTAGTLSVFPAAGCGAATCTPTWTADLGTAALTSPAITPSTVFVGTADGHLFALPAHGCGNATCTPTWSGNIGAAVTGPSVVGSVVYLGASDGTLAAFDASGCGQATCSALWTTNLGAALTKPVAVGAGRVYASDDGGTLHAYALP
jgi:hypothetical protein